VRLLFSGRGWPEVCDHIRAHLAECDELRLWDRAQPLAAVVGDIDVLLPSNAVVTAEVIEAASSLRLIQQPAAGYDKIDLEAARRRGIPVCNAPGTNAVAVAEAALLLMLALVRRLPLVPAALAAARVGQPVGRELAGKTLGIVGHGRSGRALGERARACAMRVLGVDSRSSRAELEHLLAQSDIVSLHVPLGPRTRHLIGARELACLKPGALLVNCARAQILDREAVVRALDEGRLAGLGLDVLWQEPWRPDDPLLGRDDVVVLPHIGGSTREAYDRIAAVVADNVERLRSGRELLHRLV
jgi:phosphoglycerate dehydrogenase-like enzyme